MSSESSFLRDTPIGNRDMYRDIDLPDSAEYTGPITDLKVTVKPLYNEDFDGWPSIQDEEPIALISEHLPANPKQIFGDKKVPMHLWPDTATIFGALAFGDGAVKYGPYNWRENKVEAMTYVAALKRHLAAWVDGEEMTLDTKLPHLGHALRRRTTGIPRRPPSRPARSRGPSAPPPCPAPHPRSP